MIERQNTTLVLAAHGSPFGKVNQSIERLAASLRDQSGFADVIASIYHAEGGFRAAFDRVKTKSAVVVPLMTSTGYFAKEVLRDDLSAHQSPAKHGWRVARPIGLHAKTTSLIWQRLHDAVVTNGFAPTATTVIVVGHGTRRNRQSRQSTRDLVDQMLRHNAGDTTNDCNRYAQIACAFLDDRPSILQIQRRIRNENVIVMPFLISDGPHFRRDIPRGFGLDEIGFGVNTCLGSSFGKKIVIESPLGLYPEFPALILQLADEALRECPDTAASRLKLRIGTRGSLLALRQSEIVRQRLTELNIESNVTVYSTTGDQDQTSAVSELGAVNPFADSIELALQNGEIDLAVHSYKDLDSKNAPAGLRIAAVLERTDPREVLVTRDRCTLAELPRGAVIGTSCLRRAAQIKRLLPDISTRNIRGAVDNRLQQVADGKFDGVVLAAAGLLRLGLKHKVAQTFRFKDALPAAAQAALVVQTRAGDAITNEPLSRLEHFASRVATDLERHVDRLVTRWPGRTVAVLARFDGLAKICYRVFDVDGNLIDEAKLSDINVDRLKLRLTRRIDRRCKVKPGQVWLVGAGPGDAGLISVAGLNRLRAAEVVVHDRLISPVLLTEIPDDAVVIDAGKYPLRHKLHQDAICDAMVQYALQGKQVVRLKGGDPFVFGRGYEELEFCRKNRIRCQVIPGISSALAAPAAAGIAVTERSVAASVTIFAGESGATYPASNVEFKGYLSADTLVMLMGRRQLSNVAEGLRRFGRSADTPVACVENATMPTQRVVTGTLANIADRAEQKKLLAPMVTIVGDVAARASQGVTDRKLDRLTPLAGLRVVVTRPRSSARELVEGLFMAGAEVLITPAIRVVGMDVQGKLRSTQLDLNCFEVVAFTSPNAVGFFANVLRCKNRDWRWIKQIAAVGPATAKALNKLGIHVDLQPVARFSAESLSELLVSIFPTGTSVLLPCSQLAGNVLQESLRQAGLNPRRWELYATRDQQIDKQTLELDKRPIDVVTFCSPSAVHSWMNQGLPNGFIAGCIGRPTEQAAQSYGIQTVVGAQESTCSLVAALVDYFQKCIRQPILDPELAGA